jgi:hypothetical protein
MPNQADAEAHQAAGVIPAAPWRVKALNVLPDYCLAVTFRMVQAALRILRPSPPPPHVGFTKR